MEVDPWGDDDVSFNEDDAGVISEQNVEDSFAEPQQVPNQVEIKLFGRWRYDEVKDVEMALSDYIMFKGKCATFLPHTCGRYQMKRFRKAQCPIIERLVCSLMFHGRNAGKKLTAMRIVRHSFEIIHLLTNEVILFI
ncbi:hypothetical protein GJ496_003285 [Pomphorhynchus laevis]|nr:hypothetical protein GJ496_003285 [Pomphorhynchus laevis]